MIEDRLAFRKDTFQQGISMSDVKRKRYETAITLRKEQRQKRAIQYRFDPTETAEPTPSMLKSLPQLNSVDSGQKLKLVLQYLTDISQADIQVADLRFLRLQLTNVEAFELALEAPFSAKLIECLRSSDAIILEEALWILTNIASGPPDLGKKLIRMHAAEGAFRVVCHPDLVVVRQAVWFLGNLACDMHSSSIHILELGLLSKIEGLIDRGDEDLNVNIVWLIENIISKPPIPQKYLNEIFSFIPKLIVIDHTEILTHTLKIFSVVAERLPQNLVRQIDDRFQNAIFKSLRYDIPMIIEAGLRALGSVAYSSDLLISKYMKDGLLNDLDRILVHRNRYLKKTTLWVASNLLGTTDMSIKYQVIHHPFMAHMLELTNCGDEPITTELLFCFSNAVELVDSETVLDLSFRGGIEILVSSLSVSKPNNLMVALKLLQKIFEIAYEINKTYDSPILKRFDETGGITKLTSLMSTQQSVIFKQVKYLVDNFIEVDDEPTTEDMEPVSVFSFS
mmetsp:Transcript_16958/g.30489  ORF Transcript_16958/g.30489 Transcript_16958/m.30489 type:complete len:508 (+) Transcript_16958:9392-10915(+)